MKKNVLFILLVSIGLFCFGQDSPTLSLTGSSPSLTKGNINTEVLTAIIQQKQEEIKERVFRNTIIKQFKNSENHYTKKLNNFTTFHYMYNLMDVLTSGKNKTVMTKKIIEGSAEFSFIFGLALYVDNQKVEDAKVESLPDGNKKVKIEPKNVKDFNLLIDLCYVIVLENINEIQKHFKFDDSKSNVNFNRWYESDNVFLKEMKKAEQKSKNSEGTSDLDELKELKDEVENKIKGILSFSSKVSDMLDFVKGVSVEELKKKISKLYEQLNNFNGDEISSNIDALITEYSRDLTDDQKEYLNELSAFFKNDYNSYKELYNFYAGLKKNNFEDFNITKRQYYAMKFILVEFVDLAKNQFPNDAVATVLDFLLENTLVEFNDLSGRLLDDDSNDDEKLGYLYVDIESLISTIDQRFNSITQKGVTNYITPFFSIGTNYASFLNSNSLLNNNESIGNLYFASEKIGFKWKLWNWKYTHSFGAGESFKYYWKHTYWLRPQEEPLISDVHLIGYGSGLLYNLVDLKSEDSFNYATVGGGVGITFFNGLSTNVSIAAPIVNQSLKYTNSYINFGIDIPIIEYISALTKRDRK